MKLQWILRCRLLIISITTVILTVSTSSALADGANPLFTFSDDVGATYTCQLDANVASACSGSQSYSGLSPGEHAVTIQGTFDVTAPSSNATSCPSPTGTVMHANPGDDLTAKSNALSAGNTLVLNDGTYSPSVDNGALGAWYVHGIHGTASNPIIIEAANDGGATVTGANDTTRDVFYLTSSSYVTICGLNFKNAPDNHAVFEVWGAGGNNAGDGTVNNITVERSTATNAPSGDVDCFKFGSNDLNINAHVLFQDDAAKGPCRYGFANHHVNGVTDRRDWAYNMGVVNFANAPRSGFNAYGSQNVTLENDISNNIPSRVENDYYTGVYQTSNDPSNFPQTNAHYYGDMFFNVCEGINSTANAGPGTIMKDLYVSVPANSTCQADLGSRYTPFALHWNDSSGFTASNVVINDSNTGAQTTGGTISFLDSALVNNKLAIGNGSFSHSYTDFNGNGSNGASLSGTDMSSNPGYDTATYGTPGAYLMPAPNLRGKGSGGADVGAHITDEYVNGTLTSTPLWPWPMESRIRATFGVDVDAFIWKTLP